MDSIKAREVLRLYRPGSTDALDPQIAEALQLVQTDPELARWFEAQCGVYIAIRGKLRQIEIPADLKRNILINNVDRPRRIIPLFKPSAAWAAAAAIVITALGLWAFLQHESNNRFADFRDTMVRIPQRGYAMDFLSSSLAEINSHLRAEHAISDYTLTKPMEKLPAVGCVAKTWHGKPYSMICLNAGQTADGKAGALYLFVANRSDLTEAPPPGGKPQFGKVQNLNAASWTVGDKVYVLAGEGDDSELRHYLE